MIDFNKLEANKEEHRLNYLCAQPFPYLSINNLCDSKRLSDLCKEIPLLDNKSKDYMFAKNKFEKSNYGELGPLLKELNEDLHSERMNEFLSYISAKEVFVDPRNHGGGLHQGRENSFLDMHLDFNYHPMNKLWYREMNLLFYLNEGWQEEYGGKLKIEDLRTGKKEELDVNFNTLIIQQCSSFSLHGYDPTNFPDGKYRTSIATYSYIEHIRHIEKPRTTDWFPSKEGDSAIKKEIGRNFKHIVKVKNRLFGSGTSKNQ